MDRTFEGWQGRRGSAVLLACTCFALMLGLARASVGPAPSFAGPRFYRTAGFTYSVAIGDLNGDAKLDLATANGNEYSPTVSVFLNRGGGSFRAGRTYEAGKYGPNTVVIGDLNGDGKRDLATANSGVDTVSVLLNNGNGSFRTKRDYKTGGGTSSLAIGDLNGDGNPDLATANISANTVSVLMNRGDGSFQAKRDYTTGRYSHDVAIRDLNGDGKPELATANYNANTVSVLVNRGDGSFRAKVDYGTGRGPYSVAIGDLNGDGKADLASANCGSTSPNGPCFRAEPNTVSVLLNRGDGTFQPKVDYRAGRTPYSVAIGDLNGDSRPELVTANLNFKANSVSVLANKGDGSFHAKVDYEAGDGPVSVTIGDLNGDGKPDLAAAILGERPQFDSRVAVLANATGLCGVPYVKWKTLPTAKRTITRADCRVGRIRRAYSTFVKRGLVFSQKPGSGRLLPIGSKVNLVVSRGKR
jgi:hypothetical protein